MQILVSTLIDGVLPFDVGASDTVATLKNYIADKTGTPKYSQHLLLGTTLLADETVLNNLWTPRRLDMNVQKMNRRPCVVIAAGSVLRLLAALALPLALVLALAPQ